MRASVLLLGALFEKNRVVFVGGESQESGKFLANFLGVSYKIPKNVGGGDSGSRYDT